MKVCFVGAGSIGKRHIKNVTALAGEMGVDLEIHLIRATDRQLPDEIQSRVKKVFHSFDEADDRYDIVFITNPTNLHYETLQRMLDKSDAFFVEKPVFDDINADLKPFDIAGKHFYVACPLRYTKVLNRALEISRNEKVISARAISSSYLPDWRPGTDYRQTYSAHKEQGGGVRIDLIHEWDYLINMFGAPDKVSSISGKYSDLEIDSEDLAVYIAEYKDMLIELHLDYCGKVARRSLELITTDHIYVFDIINGKVICDGLIKEEYSEDPNDKYLEEMRHFIKIINGEVKNTSDLSHAICAMKVAEGK